MNPIIGFVYVWYGKNTVKVALLHQEAGRQMGGESWGTFRAQISHLLDQHYKLSDVMS